MNKEQAHSYIDRVFGEWGKVGKDGIVIRDAEVSFMLAVGAELMSMMPCQLHECEKCNAWAALWWEWCMSLSGPVRVRLQGHLRTSGIPLPKSPWEEVPTNAVPTALN